MKRLAIPVLLGVSLVLALVALIVGGLALYGVRQFQAATLASVAEVRVALADLSERTFETNVPIRQSVPVSVSFPLDQEFLVPIRTTIPFSTTVRVPIEIPILGTRTINVPVQTEVPVDLEVVIPVSQTVSINTDVALNTDIPIQINLREMGLGDVLEELDGMLIEVEEDLQWP